MAMSIMQCVLKDYVKKWYIHMVEYCIAIKNDNVILLLSTQKDIEDIFE